MQKHKERKSIPNVIVIGLDGACWNIIEPLIKEGKLEIMARLVKNGATGYLESSIPYNSIPAWKCYSTGKNPAKFGVFDFLSIDIRNRKYILNNSTSFRSKEIWDYLSDYGVKCGVFKMISTHPAKKINGFMVSEYPFSQQAFFPKELKKEIEDKFGPIYLDIPYMDDKDGAIELSEQITKKEFKVAKYLFDRFKPHFFHITIYHTDAIQHFYWRYMEEKDPKYGKVIERFWKVVDSEIKEFLDGIIDKENTYIILMSDHGFQSMKYKFNISIWLIKEGYLSLNIKGKIFFIFLSFLKLRNIEKLYMIYKKITSIVRKLQRKPIKEIQKFGVSGGLTSKLIDWEKSTVIPLQGSMLYIKEKQFMDKLVEELNKIKNPFTNKLLVKKILKKEEIYSGDYISQAPDIVIIPTDNITISATLYANEEWTIPSKGWSGDHSYNNGILVFYGNNIKKGINIGVKSIFDLAPTILYIYGIPAPSDMDGIAIKEIFEVPPKKIRYKQRIAMKTKEIIKKLKTNGKI